jgi:hypothetical protein
MKQATSPESSTHCPQNLALPSRHRQLLSKYQVAQVVLLKERYMKEYLMGKSSRLGLGIRG